VNPAITAYAGILRVRWRWLMWGVLLAIGATTLFMVVQPPMYRSEQTVFVRTPGDVSQVLDGGDSYAQGRARTYAAVASSPDLAARVISDLKLEMDPEVLSRRIKAKNRPGTVLVDISVDARSATEALQTATVVYSEFAAMVRSLESVPGSLVPRAELVQVNPPGPPGRTWPWKAPIPVMLLFAAIIGITIGGTAAVLRSTLVPDRKNLSTDVAGSVQPGVPS
jgi:capsular polysaccharide biosynthesis protein